MTTVACPNCVHWLPESALLSADWLPAACRYRSLSDRCSKGCGLTIPESGLVSAVERLWK